jgi:hypothetical protein
MNIREPGIWKLTIKDNKDTVSMAEWAERLAPEPSIPETPKEPDPWLHPLAFEFWAKTIRDLEARIKELEGVRDSLAPTESQVRALKSQLNILVLQVEGLKRQVSEL